MYIMSEDNQLTRKNIFQLFKDAVSGKEQDFTTGSIRKAVFFIIHSDDFRNAHGIYICFGRYYLRF